MNLLAIIGSPLKGKVSDTLVDKAIEGTVGAHPEVMVRKLHLADFDLNYCRNCLACRDRLTDAPVSECTIRDGMDDISKEVLASDGLIFGTPVHMGYPPALMMSFLERICWTFAKPEGGEPAANGSPVPRSKKQRKAVIIVVSGIVPPLHRRRCDSTTPLIRRTIQDSLNAKTVGDLYADDIEHRGVDRYCAKATRLGHKLALQFN